MGSMIIGRFAFCFDIDKSYCLLESKYMQYLITFSALFVIVFYSFIALPASETRVNEF